SFQTCDTMTASSSTGPAPATAPPATAFKVLGAISVAHMMNDMIQSILLAIYPMLKESFDLSFAQIGLITLTYQLAASLLQPCVGLYTDKRPTTYSLPVGMGFTLVGLLLLAYAPSLPYLLVAAALVGTGSSVFHPESSRVARMAAGSRPGLAQSLFQVGGNVGSALGPLLAAFVVLPYGQSSLAWFSVAALVAIMLLVRVGGWYRTHGLERIKPKAGARAAGSELPQRRVAAAVAVLIALVFSKFIYTASMSSYYTFYLIDRFGVSVQSAQLHLFVFLGSVAFGTVAGGAL